MNMKINSDNKLTALITGASSGLGESIAKNLAGRGTDLILVSENPAELKRVKKDIESRYQCSITILEMDLFKHDSADRILDFCDNENLAVDILVNCAGMFLNIEREMKSIGCIENVINLHVLSLTKLCFLFGRSMIEQKRGYILNISSIAAEFPDPASLTYGPTKRYILSFSEALHCEWKHHNIRVTCLTPGGLRTNFFSANNVFLPPIIKFTLLSPDTCAEIGLNAMFSGKARVTPGITSKLQSFFLKMISRPATYPIIKRSYFSMKNRTN
jgi:short-subunit dehydrogenase